VSRLQKQVLLLRCLENTLISFFYLRVCIDILLVSCPHPLPRLMSGSYGDAATHLTRSKQLVACFTCTVRRITFTVPEARAETSEGEIWQVHCRFIDSWSWTQEWDGVICTEEGAGRIKTIEGSKEAVKAKGQTKHMMFRTSHDWFILWHF